MNSAHEHLHTLSIMRSKDFLLRRLKLAPRCRAGATVASSAALPPVAMSGVDDLRL